MPTGNQTNKYTKYTKTGQDYTNPSNPGRVPSRTKTGRVPSRTTTGTGYNSRSMTARGATPYHNWYGVQSRSTTARGSYYSIPSQSGRVHTILYYPVHEHIRLATYSYQIPPPKIHHVLMVVHWVFKIVQVWKRQETSPATTEDKNLSKQNGQIIRQSM